MDQQIAHYEILQELGSGTVGQVFRARNVNSDEIVALKLLRSSLAPSSEVEQRFVPGFVSHESELICNKPVEACNLIIIASSSSGICFQLW